MILSKKQLFDLEVKGQGPMKVITVNETPHYGHAPTYQISLTYLERQKCHGSDKLRWEEEEEAEAEEAEAEEAEEAEAEEAETEEAGAEEAEAEQKFRLKQYVSLRLNGRHNYLTLTSKVKVPRRSLWYATHRIMVMHPHTKYHWPISKDKNVMARTSFAEKRKKRKRKKRKWKKRKRKKNSD